MCDGSAISRETYAALFSVIGATYGAGDGTATFNLPNLTDKFIEGSATAGTVKSAGLPNITGNLRDFATYNPLGTGVFQTSAFNQHTVGGTTVSLAYYQASFDASRSNSIYGNSTTVQPPAVTMKYAIYSGVVSRKLWLRTI